MLRNLLTISDLSKQDILAIFKRVDELRQRQPDAKIDVSKLGGLLFFETSTRTRIGFEAAAWKLGIKSVVMQETKLNDTMSKAESMRDTIRTLDPYVSFFCIRHPDENIFSEVVPFTKRPVINCGNGYEEHPTQALIDAYTMWSKFGGLDGLNITMIGELKYARAVHSLILLLAKFSNVTVSEIAPTELQIQADYKKVFETNGNVYNGVAKPSWGKEQVVYVTGFPPKNPSGTFSQAIRDKYKITKEIVSELASESIILNALPRIDEIDEDVDDTPNAYYFQQNEFGLYVRMAVIERYCL
ncbi:MAG TPA: hypothetical protein VFN56_02850 [Candidatus Saccharimonadales bacterium]|nr:hypothetical protein [Candidatus Saccharimonadales bacterium]